MKKIFVLIGFLVPMVASFAIKANVVEGEPFPYSLGNDQAGEPIQLPALRGKVVLISFWTSWCGPCRKELPKLASIQQKAGQFGIQVISVNVKEDRKIYRDAVRFFRDSGMLMVHDRNGKLADAVGVDAFPRLLVLGKNGLIEGDYRGYSEETFERLIEQIIKLSQNESTPTVPGATAEPANAFGS